MEALNDTLGAELLGISLQQLLVALVAIGLGFGGGRILEAVFGKLHEKTPPESLRRAILGAFDRPIGWVARISGIWVALTVMPLDTVAAVDLTRFINAALQGATVAIATWFGVRVVEGLSAHWGQRAERTEGTFDDQLVPIVRKAGKVFLVITGAVMVVQNMGYSVSSLLAGLGLGGAALAFASKDTVANFFGSIVIFVDRPFQIGDWVDVGTVEGTVETVGIRVTRIRTFSNSLITVPNAMFTTTAINNWSRMKKRRIKMTIGLTYSTSPDKMRQAVRAIRQIIRADDRLHQDFFLVNFFDFGSSSLDIFCYLFTRTTSWAEHMQIREEFMLKTMESMSELGLEFAFPTRTLHVDGLTAPGTPLVSTPAGEPAGAPAAMLRDTPL